MRPILSILLLASLALSIDPACVGYQNVRSINGFCNNLDHPYWSNANVAERRLGFPRYTDNLTMPFGGPNARIVSQKLFALQPQKEDLEKTFADREFGPKPEFRDLNMFSILTLQFLTHDMAFTPLIFNPDTPELSFGIEIVNCTPATSSKNDELCIWPANGDPNALPFPQAVLFTRESQATLINGVFTPETTVTGFVDLSTVYGSDVTTSNKLRSFVDGKLLVGNNSEPLPRAADIGVENDCGPFVTDGFGAGDIRVDENTGIITLHIAFLRYHNYICDQLKAAGVTGDQNLFNQARDITIGTWQHIVYDELLPAIFGTTFMDTYMGAYTGYNANVDPSITVESQTAGFRFHNLLNLPLLHSTSSCDVIYGEVEIFMNVPQKTNEHFNCQPQKFRDTGVENVVRGLTLQHAHFFDETVTDAIRNLRITAPGNVDVASADIFRSRLHGMPDYNTFRVMMGLDSVYSHCTAGATVDPLNCFTYFTSNVTLANEIRDLYGKVSKMDAIVGIHAENIPSHSSVSQSAAAIELAQLKSLRDGDRFFWKSYLSAPVQATISSKKMQDVLKIAFPSITSELSPNAFFVNRNHVCSRDSCDSATLGKPASDIYVTAVVADQYGDTNALRQYRVVATIHFPTSVFNWRIGIILPSIMDHVVSYPPNFSVYNGATYSCGNANPNSFTIKPAGPWAAAQISGSTVTFEYIATNSANVAFGSLISGTKFTTWTV